MNSLAHSPAPDSPDTLSRFLSINQVAALTGLSPTTLWRLRRRGDLPAPTRLSPGRVAWPEAVIRQFLEGR